MTPDLKELDRLARAATPGPWTYDGDTWELSAPSRKGKVEIATIETGWTEPMESEQQANIAYILAANPAAILSLIAELEQFKNNLRTATNVLQSVLNGKTSPMLAQEVVNALNEFQDAAIAKEQS